MGKLVFKFNATVEVEDKDITKEQFEEYMAFSQTMKNDIEQMKKEIETFLTEDCEGVTAKIRNFKLTFEE